MSAPVVETHSLAKTYGLALVARDVDLRLLSGAGAFVIGRKRRGKIHLFANLAGLEARRRSRLRLRAGHAKTRGALPASNRRDGASEFLYPNLTARENLEFFGELYSLAEPRASADRWLSRIGLATLPMPCADVLTRDGTAALCRARDAGRACSAAAR